MNSRELIVVNGRRPVSGTVEVRGAKNSVLKLMAASVMASGETRIGNVPFISDVDVMSDVLTTIGASVTREEGSHSLSIRSKPPFSLKACAFQPLCKMVFWRFR